MSWHRAGSTSDTEYMVTRLAEGVHYMFRVSAENSQGVGPAEELSKSVAAKSAHSKYCHMGKVRLA